MLTLLACGWAIVGALGVVGVVVLVFEARGDGPTILCGDDLHDSEFGDGSWSWWPVGLSCKYSSPSRREDPGWAPTALAVGWIAVGAELVRFNRRGQRR